MVYDAAVLIAADRGDRHTWSRHLARLTLRERPIVSAAVIAQVSRSSQQAEFRRFLKTCEIAFLDETDAHQAGRLLRLTNTKDIVDAVVVVLALRLRAKIVTNDMADIGRLVAAAGGGIAVVRA